MTDPEKVMAFQQNRMTLATADLDQKACILALADQLDLMLTAESSLADWEQKLHRNCQLCESFNFIMARRKW